VVRPGHPLLARQPLDLALLSDFPLLMPTATAIIRPFVERFLIGHGLAGPGARIESVSDSFGRAYVRRTDAIWAISEGVVIGDVEAGTLAALPLDTSETRGAVGITLRADFERGPLAAHFLRCLRAAAEAMRAGST
jgi:LysR family pca operon transcriptional activator